MNLNKWARGKSLTNRLVFAGGHPLFRWLPKVVKWGPNISLYWLGTELVWLGKKETSMAKFKGRKLKHGELDRSPKTKPCVACNGSGRYDSAGSPKCSACNGTGKQGGQHGTESST